MRKLTTEERRRRRFTEAFRKEQVGLLDRGEATIAQVSRQYQVKADSIKRWVRKYSKQSIPEAIVIGCRDDYDHMKVLENENLRLKQYIGEQQMRLVYMEQVIALAKERLGNDFEKK